MEKPKMPRTNGPGRRSERRRVLHLVWAAPLAVALVALATTSTPAPVVGLQEPPPTDTVMVRAQCIGNGGLGLVSVNPWTVRVPEPTNDLRTNAEIMWVLDDDSQDADRIVVEPKQLADWPFPETRHEAPGRGLNRAARSRRMSRQIPARAGRAQPQDVQLGDRFQYNIIVHCTVNGDAYTVVIDPDVEVGDGGA